MWLRPARWLVPVMAVAAMGTAVALTAAVVAAVDGPWELWPLVIVLGVVVWTAARSL